MHLDNWKSPLRYIFKQDGTTAQDSAQEDAGLAQGEFYGGVGGGGLSS